MTRMQLRFRSTWSTCAFCNFSSIKANSLSASADNSLGLFKSLSPSKVLFKLVNSLGFIPIVGCRWDMSPSNLWNSFRVSSWYLLIYILLESDLFVSTFCSLHNWNLNHLFFVHFQEQFVIPIKAKFFCTSSNVLYKVSTFESDSKILSV